MKLRSFHNSSIEIKQEDFVYLLKSSEHPNLIILVESLLDGKRHSSDKRWKYLYFRRLET